MGIHPNEISTDALLEQAGWLTALARRLVRDPAEADDVAQETMLTALSSGEPAPRRWLAHVARNIARARARSQSARVKRESARGVPPTAPSSSDLAEKLEAQGLLVEAVRGLAEPYRTTILLHYWEHKTSEEIAAIQNVPSGTVRWRLKQAVDSLRQRLDAQHGNDRRAWSALLVPLFKSTTTGAAATSVALSGIIAMKLFLQITAALVVLLGVGVGVWVLRTPPTLHDVAALANASSPAQLDPPPKNPVDVPDLDETHSSTRTPQPVTEPTRKQLEQVVVAHVEARILDELARPISGARISVMRNTAISPVSDLAGRLAFDVAGFQERSPDEFEVTASSRATRILSAKLLAGKTTYLGDVVLQPGGSVSGRILDEHDQAVTGARVGLESVDVPESEAALRAQSPSVGKPSAVSAADGSYLIDGAPVGPCRVVAVARLHQAGHSEIVELRAGALTSGIDVDLPALSADRMVRGVVLDPDGQPVPGARIEYGYLLESSIEGGSFSTDEHGRFDEVVQPGTIVELVAHDKQGRWSDAPAARLQPSDKDIVLRFCPVQWMEISVTDADGKPVEKWKGRFESPEYMRPSTSTYAFEHTDSIAKVQVPSGAFSLSIEARGFANAKVGPFEPAAVGARIDVNLRRAPGISGQVVSTGGPVANAKVRLFAEAEGRVEHNGFLVNIDPNSRDETRTASDGTFQLATQDAGGWIVRADAEGFAPTERKLTHFDSEQGFAGLELTLSAGGSIEGHVLALPGREPVGTVVAVSRGDGFARTQRVGPDGAFAFDHLMPGRWMVSRRREELNPLASSMSWLSDKPVEVPWNCEVSEGRKTRFDLGADASSMCTLRGKLRFQGAPSGTWNALLANEPGSPKPVLLDASGSFELERAEAGSAQLLLTAVDGPFEGTRILAPITLAAGETKWSEDILAATLALHGAGSGSTVPLAFVVVRDDQTLIVRPLPGQGDVEIVVPSGQGRVVRMDPTTMKGVDTRSWSGGLEVKVEPDEIASVERP